MHYDTVNHIDVNKVYKDTQGMEKHVVKRPIISEFLRVEHAHRERIKIDTQKRDGDGLGHDQQKNQLAF